MALFRDDAEKGVPPGPPGEAFVGLLDEASGLAHHGRQENPRQPVLKRAAGPVQAAAPPEGRAQAGPFSHWASAEALLADYWGEKWPEVHAEILANGGDLGTVDTSQIPDWSEVQDYFRQKIVDGCLRDEEKYRSKIKGWLDGDTVVHDELKRLSISAETVSTYDLKALESLVQQGKQELSAIADSYFGSILQASVEGFDTGRGCAFHPIVYPSAKILPDVEAQEDKHLFRYQSILGKYWAVRLSVYEEDHPELSLLETDAALVRADYLARFEDYAKDL